MNLRFRASGFGIWAVRCKTAIDVPLNHHRQQYTLLLNNEEAKILSLKEWSPFLEENSVIRENGRLKWTKIPYEWKCHLNIILPAKHVTTVLVREYHSHGHLGPE